MGEYRKPTNGLRWVRDHPDAKDGKLILQQLWSGPSGHTWENVEVVEYEDVRKEVDQVVQVCERAEAAERESIVRLGTLPVMLGFRLLDSDDQYVVLNQLADGFTNVRNLTTCSIHNLAVETKVRIMPLEEQGGPPSPMVPPRASDVEPSAKLSDGYEQEMVRLGVLAVHQRFYLDGREHEVVGPGSESGYVKARPVHSFASGGLVEIHFTTMVSRVEDDPGETRQMVRPGHELEQAKAQIALLEGALACARTARDKQNELRCEKQSKLDELNERHSVMLGAVEDAVTMLNILSCDFDKHTKENFDAKVCDIIDRLGGSEKHATPASVAMKLLDDAHQTACVDEHVSHTDKECCCILGQIQKVAAGG
jgi:hypothetical protein